MKIKIITNYQSDELYSISKGFYSDLGYEMIGVDGSNGFYSFNFLNYIILNKYFFDVDLMVYIDEDCFIVDKLALLDLIKFVVENNVDCIGMPDGGIIEHRAHNPVSINQFFCILNLKKIREKYDINEVINTKYTNELKKYTPYDILKSEIPICYDEFEPYYKLFFWMLKNDFNFRYLNAYSFSDDKTTTILKNHNGVDFAYHTWYARGWNNPNHKERILKIIKFCNTIKK
jgi:hypothetical protein